MTTKRSRVARSSSQGEVGFLNQNRTLEFESPVAFFEKKRQALAPVAKPAAPQPVKNSKPRGSILTLGSPERKTSDVWSKKKEVAEGFGEFLKACALCKKKLDVEKDIFMYGGYLNAFCSPECRDDQIALDGFDREIALDYAKRLKMAGIKKDMPWRGYGY